MNYSALRSINNSNIRKLLKDTYITVIGKATSFVSLKMNKDTEIFIDLSLNVASIMTPDTKSLMGLMKTKRIPVNLNDSWKSKILKS